MPPEPAPLLTLAIPTYNRSSDLAGLLAVLLPQLRMHPEVDLFISDNASGDDTESVVRELLAQGHVFRYQRHGENIGADRNFVYCFEQARGRYFWMCGDDDIICPGALDRVLTHLADSRPLDLMYLASYPFRADWAAERTEDKFKRNFQTFTDPVVFARVVNIMFTFISGIVVNRERLLALPHEAPEALLNTNLTQLGWSLPLLLSHRRSVVLWQRSLAGRVGQAGGYDLGKVFGLQLRAILERLLHGRPDLQHAILGPTVQRWLPSVLVSLRRERNTQIGLTAARLDFNRAYRDRLVYWLFAWPVLRLPVPLATVWQRAGQAVSQVHYMLTVPGFWRKET